MDVSLAEAFDVACAELGAALVRERVLAARVSALEARLAAAESPPVVGESESES